MYVSDFLIEDGQFNSDCVVNDNKPVKEARMKVRKVPKVKKAQEPIVILPELWFVCSYK